MALKEVILPSMGEGITEASIIRWLVEEGDSVKIDQPLVEIATDKVDSEIPSPFEGVLKKIITVVGAIPRVGDAVALILDSNDTTSDDIEIVEESTALNKDSVSQKFSLQRALNKKKEIPQVDFFDLPFIPPYVRLVASKLNIDFTELALFSNKKAGDTFSKDDIEKFVSEREYTLSDQPSEKSNNKPETASLDKAAMPSYSGVYRTEEMGRIRKRIADRMVRSSNTIPHVTSFIEADVTNMALWREKNKDSFFEQYKTKLTFTPLFIEAIVHALKQYPEVNVSIDGDNIIFKEAINIGMATILPDKDLIVPVVKQADSLNLFGLARTVNDLAARAREKNLKPEEIMGSTFTFTNIGVFGTLTGTPLINLPEAAILAIGSINKKPDAVLTSEGYGIGLRDKVMLSLAYDHRIIDGGLGGIFLKSISDFISNFDPDRQV